ncbi:MAG: hypothetical protein ABI797_01515 [Chloroflexota bacterium]
MTTRDRFDAVVATWLLERGPAGMRPAAIDDALTAAARQPQYQGLRGWLTGPAPWPAAGNLSIRRPSPAMRFALVAAFTAVAVVGATDGAARLLGPAEVGAPTLRGVFEELGSLPVQSTNIQLLPDGRLILIGGAATARNGLGSLSNDPETIFAYDPLTGESQPLATTSGSIDVAVPLLDGRVLLVEPSNPARGGGSTLEIFDPATGSIDVVGPTLGSHLSGAAVRLEDGRVLLIGDAAGTADAEIFDPTTGSLSPTGQTNAAMRQPTATLLPDGQVLIVGEWERTAELYNPVTNQFAPTGALSALREAFSATLLRDGRVLIAGGWTLEGTVVDGVLTPTAPAALAAAGEIYDPATGTFAPTGPMVTPRVYHFAVALADGRVLVGGGSASDRADPGSGGIVEPVAGTGELFDPATGSFTPTGTLNLPRFGSGAVRLDDGTVLVIGSVRPLGAASEPDPAALSLEIYK